MKRFCKDYTAEDKIRDVMRKWRGKRNSEPTIAADEREIERHIREDVGPRCNYSTTEELLGAWKWWMERQQQ